MKNILLGIAILFSISVKSQTSVYHPFPDSNAVWNINEGASCIWSPFASISYSIVISGDTTINSVVYHKLNIPYVDTTQAFCLIDTPRYLGSVRQDTSLRMVYIVPPFDSVEQILYDFNLNVGDTVQGYLERNNGTQKDVVISKDSVLVGGQYCNRWFILPGYSVYLIEGIGSTFGLTEALPGNVIDGIGFDLMCFQQNGAPLYPYGIPFCNLIDGTDQLNFEQNYISVFPNPMSNVCQVNLPDFFSPYQNSLQVFNILGEMVLNKQTVGSRFSLDTRELSTGIFIVVVKSGSKEIGRQKLVVE
ncbi:MAG: T9SS type A sorting domain-containing protein [Bacteroidetes bacterium]|nr:T9SS type A sorting domain-containing protein [Bacteroidota bacterium]